MMQTGDKIDTTISGLSVSTLTNKVVTVIDDNTFSFTSTGSDGTITNPSVTTNNWRFSGTTIRNLVKRLATLVKAMSVPFALSYSVLQGITVNNEANTGDPTTNRYNITEFVSEGRGDLDYVDLNIYGDTTNMDKALVYTQIETGVGFSGFGLAHFRVTEWNLYQNNNFIPQPVATALYYFRKKVDYFESLGIDYYFFNYREQTNLLAATKPYNTTLGQTWRDWWWMFMGDKQRQPTQEIVFNNPTSIANLRTSPLTSIDTNMGINIGQYEQSGVFNSTNVTADLNQLYSLGIRKLRIASGDPSFTSGVNACRNLALAAKARGFYVVFVNSGGGATDANWDSTIIPQLTTFAQWASDNGIDEINMFNELDYRQTVAGVLTNSVQKQMDAYTTIHAMFPTLILSTALAQSSLEFVGASGGWIERKNEVIALGLKITYNVYGDNGNFEQFQQRIIDLQAAYPSLQISEWSLNNNWNNFPQPESEQTSQISQRLSFLISRGLPNYFFTWNWPQSNDQFALKKADGTIRSWSGALFYNPTPRTTVSRSAAGTRPAVAIT